MRVKVIPNGGWGWMVVFGAAMANMLNQSLVSLFGLIFGEELQQMGHGTTGVALVMNINSMVTNFSGLLTGWALLRYSARQVTIVGVMCTTVGMIAASFATNIAELIITYSVLTGLGLGLIMPATFLAINSYFTDQRSHAVGISMAGTGIGQMVMPQVVRYLLDAYGYRGTTLIIGAMSLNGVVGALLFQPVKWNMRSVTITEMPTEKTCLLGAHKVAHYKRQLPSLETTEKEANNQQDHVIPSRLSLCQRISNTLGLHMLGDFVFVHIIIGLALVYTCSIAFTMLYPFYLQADRGLDRAETAMCMSVLSGMDILARVTVPVVAKRLRMTSRGTFLVGALLIALARCVLVPQGAYLNILLASALCGYIRAATVINQNLTISEYANPETLPAALGLNMVAKGLFVLTVGQLFGWVRDYTDSYGLCIYIQSAVILFVVLLWSIEMIIRK